MRRTIPAIAVLWACLSGAGGAATVWDEAADGDLSGTPPAPTAVMMATGSNVVLGSVDSLTDIRDYLTFTVGTGQLLTAMSLLAYDDVTTGGPGNIGFLSLNAGSTSFFPSETSAGRFLGGDHADASLLGIPLLEHLSTAPMAGTGFSVPLGPGAYTFLLQQTSGELTAYAVSFEVSPVPLPPTAGLLSGALLMLAAKRWRSAARRATT